MQIRTIDKALVLAMALSSYAAVAVKTGELDLHQSR